MEEVITNTFLLFSSNLDNLMFIHIFYVPQHNRGPSFLIAIFVYETCIFLKIYRKNSCTCVYIFTSAGLHVVELGVLCVINQHTFYSMINPFPHTDIF